MDIAVCVSSVAELLILLIYKSYFECGDLNMKLFFSKKDIGEKIGEIQPS